MMRCTSDDTATVPVPLPLLLAGEGVQAAADTASDKAGGAIDSVKDLATEAADTARAAGESSMDRDL